MQKIHSHSTALPTLKFSSKHVRGWCQKIHLHCTISRLVRNLFLKHFESKCLYILVYLCRNIFFLQGRRKVLSGGRLNNFFGGSLFFNFFCFILTEMFRFNWNFWKFNYFSAFRYFHHQHWNAKSFQTI